MTALAIAGWLAALCTALVARQVAGRKGELVARACHELRGPITAARLGLELGARLGELPAPRLRAVEHELRGATRALDDLGALSEMGVRRRRRASGRCASGGVSRGRASRGRASRVSAVRSPEVVNVEDLITQAVEAWAAVADARGVELRSGPASTARLRCDRVRVARAAGNLIANAIEHGGGVVEVSARADGAMVRVEVTDGGPGLPAPVVDLTRRARRGRGTRGRGLAIATTIAAEHHGRISSAPSDRGARLVLELPAYDEPTPQRCSPTLEAPAPDSPAPTR